MHNDQESKQPKMITLHHRQHVQLGSSPFNRSSMIAYLSKLKISQMIQLLS